MKYEHLKKEEQERLAQDQIASLERDHYMLTLTMPEDLPEQHPTLLRKAEIERQIKKIKASVNGDVEPKAKRTYNKRTTKKGK